MNTHYQQTFKNDHMRITTNITGPKNQQKLNNQTSLSQQKQINIQQVFQNNKNQQNINNHQVKRQGTSQQPQRQLVQQKQSDLYNQQYFLQNIVQNPQKLQIQQINYQNKGNIIQVQQNKHSDEQTYKTNKQPSEYKNPINSIIPAQKTTVSPKKIEQKQPEQRPPSSKYINQNNKKEQPQGQKVQIIIQNPVENQKLKEPAYLNQVPKEKIQNNQLENKKIESHNFVVQKVNERNNQQIKGTLNQSNQELQQIQDKEKNLQVLQEKTNSNQTIQRPLSQQKSEINQIQDLQKYPIALLLGTYGVGKKWLMNKLFPNHKHQAFVPVFHPEIQIQIAYANTFDFDTDTQKREEQIQQYQQFFKKYQGYICQFFILVDHEQGITKMKQQISMVYKYFKSFKQMITIIVNKFTKTNEQIDYKSALNFYTNSHITISRNQSEVSLIFQQESKIKEKKYELILKDTVFESTSNNNQSDQKNQVQNLNLEVKQPNGSSLPYQQQQLPQTQKEIQTTKVQQSNSQPQKYIALILGTLGVGKKSLMRKLVQSTSNNIQKLTPLDCEGLSYDIALAPDFDFDSDIESRENQISSYQKFFHQHRDLVQRLFLVVNFERTDLMKNKIISIFKYFRKQKELITIIVTQFQLSENIQQDQENLKKAFKFFTNNDSIIFLKEDQQQDDICRLIQPHLKQQIDNLKYDWKNTIFEMDDPQEAQAMQDKLNQMVKKIEEEKRKRN